MTMAVVMIAIITMLMAVVFTGSLNSVHQTKKKTQHSVGMAAGDSGLERYASALRSGLADETNEYQLDDAALRQLVEYSNGDGGKATVLPNSQTSDFAGMRAALVPATSQFTVREEYDKTYGYWQVFQVVPPRYLPAGASNLVVYLRAWATGRPDAAGPAAAMPKITTKPRIFRIEYRPGYFSDYQTITDAPFFVNRNADVIVGGPIHSNGFDVQTWLAEDPPGQVRRGIYMTDAPTCLPEAEFSVSQPGTISVPGCTAARRQTRARRINLLVAGKAFDYMSRRCGTFVVCTPSSAAAGRPGAIPQATRYDVTLGNRSVSVNGQSFALVPVGDSASLVVLVDGETTVSGALTVPAGTAGRVTIAARTRNPGSPPPDVTLVASAPGAVVGAADSTKDTVGIVAQGNIVLGIPPGSPCIGRLNAAAVAQSGSVTIPTELVTLAPPATVLTGRDCAGRTQFHGAFSGHAQLVASMGWVLADGTRTPTIGYSMPTFSYNPTLFLNPPPFFPLATPWAVSELKNADIECLTTRAGDRTCS